MKIHFIKKPKYLSVVATPLCSSTGLVTTPYWNVNKEIQSDWRRSKVTCGACKRTKLFRRIK